MKPPRALAIVSCCSVVLTACAGSRVLIDGSSDDRFARSHAELVASLSREQQMQLLLAEVVLLEPKGCLATHPADRNSFMERQLGGPVDIGPCRRELHGLGFQEIMKRAYPAGGGGS